MAGGSMGEAKRGVAILVPVSDSVPGLFVHAFANAYVSIISKGLALTTFVNEAVPLEKSRERLFSDALSMEPELSYILWLDADMLVNSGHVGKLIDFMDSHPEADAATALYFRKSTYEPLCYRRLAKGGETKVPLESFMPEGSEAAEVDAAGLGCMLIRTRSVKEKLLPSLQGRKRIFWFDPDGHSEDINFCLLMRNAGMRLFALPEVSVPHAGGFVSRWHYEKKKEDGKPQ